jgi:hypothetical protein
MTPELLEATECLMVLQKRKGEEARATTAAATTTAAAAETTVAQGEATEAPQQSDQDLEEDDGWQCPCPGRRGRRDSESDVNLIRRLRPFDAVELGSGWRDVCDLAKGDEAVSGVNPISCGTSHTVCSPSLVNDRMILHTV